MTNAQLSITGYGELIESWSGYALQRSGRSVVPFIVPALDSKGRTNLACDAGAIRFWFKPYWSSVSLPGGKSPGKEARLLEFAVVGNKQTAVVWSLQVNADGSALHLVGQGDTEPVVLLKEEIDWRAGAWHLVTLNYGPKGTALFIDGELAAQGAGTVSVPSSVGALVVGSTLRGTEVAEGEFEEMAAFARPLTQQKISFYLGSTSNQAALGAITPEEDQAQREASAKRRAEREAEGEGGGSHLLRMLGGTSQCLSNVQVFITNVVAGFDTNQGWTVTFDLQGGTNGLLYDIFTTVDLAGNSITNSQWSWLEQGPACNTYQYTNQPVAHAFYVLGTPQDGDGDGLSDVFERLVSKTDPNNADTDGDGMPDGWEWSHFGTLSQTAAGDYDGNGINNGLEYTNGTDPNKIVFEARAPGFYVNTNQVTISLDVLLGVPSQVAVLTNRTDFTNAVWGAWSTNVTVNLGSPDGRYEIWVGLRGRTSQSQQTWRWLRVFKDTVAPTVVVTAPATSTSSKAVIQIQGHASEALAGISYDLQNAAGTNLNLPGFVVSNSLEVLTGTVTNAAFQCFDVRLTNGLNTVTLRATDLAGNVATLARYYTNDASLDTTAPTVAVNWPANAASLPSDTFMLRGHSDDETARISIRVAGQGQSNSATAAVWRNGRFQAENLSLGSGTNVVTVQALDANGRGSTQTLLIARSPLSVTLNPISPDAFGPSSISVSGTVSAASGYVSVNAVFAPVNGDGTWTASDVPIGLTGPADFMVNLYAPGTGTNALPDAIQLLTQERPPGVHLARFWGTRQSDWTGGPVNCGGFFSYPFVFGHVVESVDWINGIGGTRRYIQDSYNWDIGAYEHVDETDNLSPAEADFTAPSQWVDASGYRPPNHCDHSHTTYSRRSVSRLCLDTGTAPQLGEMRVYRLRIKAWEFADPEAPLNNALLSAAVGTLPLEPEWLQLWGRTLTRSDEAPDPEDGSVWGEILIATAAGATPDITPTVTAVTRQQFATLAVQAEEVKLSITANGVILDPAKVVTNASFIVGQNLTFSTNWSKVPAGIASKSVQWTFEGNFLNDSNQVSADASVNYTTNKAKLTNETTSAWWVSGGLNPPATYTARLTETLTLSNGSTVVVSGKGMFAMYRPLPAFSAVIRDSVRVGTNFSAGGIIDPGFRLQFGINTALSNAGIALIYSNAPTIPNTTNTYGRYFITQIVSSFHQRYNLRDGTNCVGTELAGNGLDTQNPYDTPSELGFGEWTDSPGGGLTTASWLTMGGSFRSHLMFQPKPYTNSIPVPMFKTDWIWSGAARTNGPPNTWSLISSNASVISKAVQSEDFPFWSMNITNNVTTTNNLPCFNEN